MKLHPHINVHEAQRSKLWKHVRIVFLAAGIVFTTALLLNQKPLRAQTSSPSTQGSSAAVSASSPESVFQQFVDAVMAGDAASMQFTNPRLGRISFIRTGGEWNVVIDSVWFGGITQGTGQGVKYYTNNWDNTAYEMYRIRDLLDTGRIQSIPKLRFQIHLSYEALKAMAPNFATTKASTAPTTQE